MLKQRKWIVYLMFLVIISNVGCASVPIDADMVYSKGFEQHALLDAESTKKLSVNIATGKCKIVYDALKDPNVDVHYYIKADNMEIINEVVSRIELKAENNDGVLSVELVEESSEEEIVDWIYGEYGNAVELSADFDIVLPASVNEFSVEVGVGDVHLEGLVGRYNIANGVGDILINNSQITGDSKFATGVGNIDLKSNVTCGIVTVSSGVGDVRLSLDEGSFDSTICDIGVENGNILVDMGMNSYSIVLEEDGYTSHRKNIELADNCEVKMYTGIGKITIR